MANFNDLLTTALSIISIATLAGLGLLRGTVTNLRENLGDARSEIEDKERRLKELEQTNARQKADLDALARVVTGEAHWIALTQQLDDHHAAAMQGITEIKAEILDVVHKLAERQ